MIPEKTAPLIESASSFILSEFNLLLKESSLRVYSPEEWKLFCHGNGFDKDSEGFYIPHMRRACIRDDSPSLLSNIFHEYFGHGLFCEHSVIGKSLEQAIRSGAEQAFLFGEIAKSEQQFGLAANNISNYEGFATWLEALLCDITGNSKVWESKRTRLPWFYCEAFEHFSQAEKELGRFGFMSQLGFPKFYDKEKLLGTLRHFYGPAFSNIDFIILYGSRRPESDIDLFVVSTNKSVNFFNGWLDIYELNRDEFTSLAGKLDISVADPLFGGTQIYGDAGHVERIKEGIIHQEITEEAIAHNLEQSSRQQRYLAAATSASDREKNAAKSHAKSYAKNATYLREGIKVLTQKNALAME